MMIKLLINYFFGSCAAAAFLGFKRKMTLVLRGGRWVGSTAQASASFAWA
jgi:hypothetical protein